MEAKYKKRFSGQKMGSMNPYHKLAFTIGVWPQDTSHNTAHPQSVHHELDLRCKVYEDRRVEAAPETLRLLRQFSEREIAKGTGLHRMPIRILRHGGTVTRKTYDKIQSLLRAYRSSARLS